MRDKMGVMSQGHILKLPTVSMRRQIANRAEWNRQRSQEGADFFTFGYSGRKIEEIVAELKRCGVRTVIDVRQHAVSMFRPEWSKRNLSDFLAENAIAYRHVPAFGVPRDVRALAIATGSRDVIWEWYDEHVVGSCANLRTALEAFEGPVAFMCTEHDPQECHRHRLSLALEELGLTSFDL